MAGPFHHDVRGDADGQGVDVFEGSDLDVVAFDIAAAEVVDVGVPEAGEAAEEKDVADGIQVSRAF